MNNILKEFWYGNICPHEHVYPNSKEMQNLYELNEIEKGSKWYYPKRIESCLNDMTTMYWN